MKKKIAALAIALTLAFPAAVAAHWATANAWQTNNQNGYTYWVVVCETNLDANQRARFIDAANEWNEIGGELRFSVSASEGSACDSLYNQDMNVVRVRFAGDLGSNTLGTTTCATPPLDYKVDDCDIRLDADGALTSWGAYTFYTGTGSPSASQVDLESVLVHEFGHALHVGHSTENEAYIMDDTLGDGGTPKGIEKDERVFAHDTQAYTNFYGTTH